MIETTKWDVVDYLKTEEDIVVAYLEAAAEENDEALTAKALENVARARARLSPPPGNGEK